MKIAFISTMKGYSWAGSEELWFDTVQSALRNDHQVLVSVYEPPSVSEKYEDLKKRGVEVHFRKSYVHPSSLTKRAFYKLKYKIVPRQQESLTHILQFNPDVVCWSCANSFDAFYRPEVPRFLMSNKLKYAMLCQGHNDEPFFHDDKDRLLVKDCYKSALWVGFVAEALRMSAKRLTASSIENSLVLRNPVNLANTDELPFPSDAETYRFAIVARLDAATKSHDVLFETFAQKQWRERNWKLSLVGVGNSEEYLKDLARYYKIEDKVDFAGQVSDIRKIWAQHHALILPSRYEGTPLALVEAMLCQRLAIVTDVGGMTEWITDDINGFVAEAAFVKYLERALERAWERRNDWKEMGKKARETALINYDRNPGETVLCKLISAVSQQ